ncbi:putative transcriptional regulatory protein pdtaR [bacterium BMS3Abin10]|nr:putative transcriptional regulatory protein pdtaR [bacterium BMS3Abin10]GBE38601.1 putative transcriptional regulatory protein pdtaR [bacterium BMS3Bbin08]HDH51030.1 GGDEF domain-containing response regulator [Nitrospirota bacterium]HDK17187.1 GGDEF domain-containing response regulator [Nitrospirota bacterium]
MAKTQIMVVEDESIVAEDIKRSLQNMGYEVPAVLSSGEDAVKKAEELRPDLILMDIVLRNKMNGIDAASHIRSILNIPIVYLTAYADEKTLERAKITEPFGYIIKPFEDRELHSIIEIALHKHGIERKLQESQQWLATVLRSIGDAVITTDGEGRVIYVNPVAEAVTGWRLGEAKGKALETVFKIISEETEEEAESPVNKVLKAGVIVGLANHTLLITRDGTRVAIDDSGAPIKDEKGNILGVVLVFRDIRERRSIEKDLARRVEELESFYHMAIGRELKMKDLKEEIEALKTELSQYKLNAAQGPH